RNSVGPPFDSNDYRLGGTVHSLQRIVHIEQKRLTVTNDDSSIFHRGSRLVGYLSPWLNEVLSRIVFSFCNPGPTYRCDESQHQHEQIAESLSLRIGQGDCK